MTTDELQALSLEEFMIEWKAAMEAEQETYDALAADSGDRGLFAACAWERIRWQHASAGGAAPVARGTARLISSTAP